MAVGHRHTWGATAFAVATLLCLQADAKGRGSSGQVIVTGPGGEAAMHTNNNQVQIWSCQGGKMNSCVVHSDGRSKLEHPLDRKPNWKVDFHHHDKHAALARRRR